VTKVSARELARNHHSQCVAPGFIDVGMAREMPDEVTQNLLSKFHWSPVSQRIVNAIFSGFTDGFLYTGHVLNVTRILIGIKEVSYYRKNIRTKCAALWHRLPAGGIRLVNPIHSQDGCVTSELFLADVVIGGRSEGCALRQRTIHFLLRVITDHR